MSERGRLAWRHCILISSQETLDVCVCFAPPSTLTLWLVMPRGFVTSRTQRLTSMGVGPLVEAGAREDVVLDGSLRDFAKLSAIDCLDGGGGEKLATSFSLCWKRRGCRAETQLISRAVRFPFSFNFHHAQLGLRESSRARRRGARLGRKWEKGFLCRKTWHDFDYREKWVSPIGRKYSLWNSNKEWKITVPVIHKACPVFLVISDTITRHITCSLLISMPYQLFLFSLDKFPLNRSPTIFFYSLCFVRIPTYER